MAKVAARSLLTVTALVALGAAITACTSKECPGPIEYSAVGITVPPHLLPRVATVTFRACVDRECNRMTYYVGATRAERSKPPRPRSFPVRTKSPLPEDAEVTVSVQITLASRVVFSGTTSAHTVKPQLYDPGCGLDSWGVGVTVHRDGRLT